MFQCKFTPLAITLENSKFGCVAGITSNYEWIRPGPIYATSILNNKPIFSYDYWYDLELLKDMTHDARNEDYIIQSVNIIKTNKSFSQEEKYKLITTIQSKNVAECFINTSSVGIINAFIKKLFWKKSTGGSHFLRAKFEDRCGKIYDWIIPEYKIKKYLHILGSQDERLQALCEKLKKSDVFLTLGLTKPNDRFPGIFKNCHPLVVGVHCFPDYEELNLTI